jgi:glutamine amidotransferase
LGLQIVLEYTEEGEKTCLGLVKGTSKRFEFDDRSIKVPHIGWNGLTINRPHPMLESIQSGDEFYFVHSYYARPVDSNNVLGITDYGDKTFCSVVARENLFATQFHLEKSGEMGLKLLDAFKRWDGTC